MTKEKVRQGKRFIALARCSSPGQVDTSIGAQLHLIEEYGRARGMECVGKIELGGVTGSVPGARRDIAELVQRKKEHNDFEVVVLQDVTRLTRSGPAHGLSILYSLRSVGVEVLFVKDDLPAGDMGDVMVTMHCYAAKSQADSIAYTATRGACASLYAGKSAHCKVPPYGIDRLYLGEDGTPKHIIRNLVDGTQVKLDPQSGNVLERFGRIKKTGVSAHYIKQKNESIQLVPGDPAHVQVIRTIFERHLRDGWGYSTIARDLNTRGVPAPRGGQWSATMVRNILGNTVYTGTGIANVSTSSVYYRRGADGPVPAEVTDEDLAKPSLPARVRPRDEWFERPEPLLADLLQPAVKTAALDKQSARLESLATRRTRPVNRDRHRDSNFILKGILVCKEGLPLTGRRSGKPSGTIRYYSVSRAYAYPTEGDEHLRRMVPAEPLETAVLNALSRALTSSKRIKQAIRGLVRRELRSESHNDKTLAELKREIAAIDQKISFVVDEVDVIGKDAARAKLQQLRACRQDLEKKVRRASGSRLQLDDPEAVAQAVCERLADLAGQLPSLPPTAVRNLLKLFVAELVVDLETRDARVTFALPEDVEVDLEKVCLDERSACKPFNEAHPVSAAILLKMALQWQPPKREYALRKLAA